MSDADFALLCDGDDDDDDIGWLTGALAFPFFA